VITALHNFTYLLVATVIWSLVTLAMERIGRLFKFRPNWWYKLTRNRNGMDYLWKTQKWQLQL